MPNNNYEDSPTCHTLDNLSPHMSRDYFTCCLLSDLTEGPSSKWTCQQGQLKFSDCTSGDLISASLVAPKKEGWFQSWWSFFHWDPFSWETPFWSSTLIHAFRSRPFHTKFLWILWLFPHKDWFTKRAAWLEILVSCYFLEFPPPFLRQTSPPLWEGSDPFILTWVAKLSLARTKSLTIKACH